MEFLSIPSALLACSLFLASCGGGEKPAAETPAEPEAPAPEVCTYSYDASTVSINWTAYKHTAKVGVKGVFDTFVVEGEKSASSVADLINGASFNIDAMSVNSKDTLRDPKLRKFFFGMMNMPGEIGGKFSDVVGTDDKGSGFALIEGAIWEVPQGAFAVTRLINR